MNAHLNYIVAQQRIADLRRAAEHARLATRVMRRRPLPTDEHSHLELHYARGIAMLVAQQ